MASACIFPTMSNHYVVITFAWTKPQEHDDAHGAVGRPDHEAMLATGGREDRECLTPPR
jgi:hypothetical protein